VTGYGERCNVTTGGGRPVPLDPDGATDDREAPVAGAAEAVRGDLAASCALTSADVTHVIIGDCHEILTFDLLDAAFRAVRAGAELIAPQHGRYTRNADGDHLDTGAVVAAVEYAAEVEARLLGKPGVAIDQAQRGD
jgi:ribonucleotide monophosphatase NagD (HAD superfamily)